MGDQDRIGRALCVLSKIESRGRSATGRTVFHAVRKRRKTGDASSPKRKCKS